MWNINNGERLITYAIEAPADSGIISLNGSAARRASVGDLVIIAAFGMLNDTELGQFKPKLVLPDAQSRIAEVRGDIAGPQAGAVAALRTRGPAPQDIMPSGGASPRRVSTTPGSG